MLLCQLPETFSQDLAAGALGDRREEEDTTPEPLMVRNPTSNPVSHLLGSDRFGIRNDIRPETLLVSACIQELVIWDTNRGTSVASPATPMTAASRI